MFPGVKFRYFFTVVSDNNQSHECYYSIQPQLRTRSHYS